MQRRRRCVAGIVSAMHVPNEEEADHGMGSKVVTSQMTDIGGVVSELRCFCRRGIRPAVGTDMLVKPRR